MTKGAENPSIRSAVQSGLIFRSTQGLTAAITAVCIVIMLNSAEQGYFLTFISLLAAQQLLELGLSTVIMQVASHESVGLEWNGSHATSASAHATDCLAELLMWAQRWYLGLAVLFLIAVVPAGWFILSSDRASTVGDTWQWPWLLAGALFAVNMVFVPALAILEGCGKISEVFIFRSWQEVGASLALWAGLVWGLGLYSMGIYLLVRAVACVLYLSRFRPFLATLSERRKTSAARLAWSRDIWPLQWKISMSFGAGYLIFQLTTPIIFALLGPVYAGQWSLTYLLLTNIGQFWLTWVSANAPQLGNFAAQRKYAEMETLFFHVARRSVAACTVGLLCAYAAFALALEFHLPYVDRFMEPSAAAILMAWAIVNHVVNVMAVYLRAHREEPFLLPSLAGGVLIPTSVYVFGSLFGGVGVATSYLVIGCVVGLGWGGVIFWQKLDQRRTVSP